MSVARIVCVLLFVVTLTLTGAFTVRRSRSIEPIPKSVINDMAASTANVDNFLTVSEWQKKSVPTAQDLPFVHLLFSHRHQRYMLLCILKTIRSNPGDQITASSRESLVEMVKIWDDLYKVHSNSEEEVLLPELVANSTGGLKAQMEAAVNQVKEQHVSLEPLEKEFRDVMMNPQATKAELLQKTKAFAAAYHNHTVCEEEELLVLAHQINSEKQVEISKGVGKFFRERPEVKYALHAMQEVASVEPGDAEIWNGRMPWVVRNIATFFVGWSSNYANYHKYFPTPEAPFDKELEKIIREP